MLPQVSAWIRVDYDHLEHRNCRKLSFLMWAGECDKERKRTCIARLFDHDCLLICEASYCCQCWCLFGSIQVNWISDQNDYPRAFRSDRAVLCSLLDQVSLFWKTYLYMLGSGSYSRVPFQLAPKSWLSRALRPLQINMQSCFMTILNRENFFESTWWSTVAWSANRISQKQTFPPGYKHFLLLLLSFFIFFR